MNVPLPVGNSASGIGEHCHTVHDALTKPLDLGQVQADELRVKAQQTTVWVAMAIAVCTRLWLGCAVAVHRDASLILVLAAKVKQ